MGKILLYKMLAGTEFGPQCKSQAWQHMPVILYLSAEQRQTDIMEKYENWGISPIGSAIDPALKNKMRGPVGWLSVKSPLLSRGPEFSSQHPHAAADNCPQPQL